MNIYARCTVCILFYAENSMFYVPSDFFFVSVKIVLMSLYASSYLKKYSGIFKLSFLVFLNYKPQIQNEKCDVFAFCMIYVVTH
jgi:hypothetical protein